MLLKTFKLFEPFNSENFAFVVFIQKRNNNGNRTYDGGVIHCGCMYSTVQYSKLDSPNSDSTKYFLKSYLVCDTLDSV